MSEPTPTPPPATPLTWLQMAARLWQPKHPAFWTMLALNAASSILVWVSQTMALTNTARLIVFVFAVGNLWLGLKCAKVLVKSSPET